MSRFNLGSSDQSSEPRPEASGRTPRVVSARQLAAHRRNALKSTGPRTPEGKARASQNARKSTGPRTPQGKATIAQNPLRHGVWAGRAVYDHEWEAFTEHVRRVFRDYEVTRGHELWGVAMAQTEWMLARLRASEEELIRTRPDLPEWEVVLAYGAANMRLYGRRFKLLHWGLGGVDEDRLLRFCDRAGILATMEQLVAYLSAVGARGPRTETVAEVEPVARRAADEAVATKVGVVRKVDQWVEQSEAERGAMGSNAPEQSEPVGRTATAKGTAPAEVAADLPAGRRVEQSEPEREPTEQNAPEQSEPAAQVKVN